LDLVHPHDIVGAAEWIWSKDAKASEIWCRGVRGTESLVYRGNQYHIDKVKMSWEASELQCQSLGPTCHLTSLHGSEEAEVVNTMAQSVFGHNQAMWIGLNDRAIEGVYVNADATNVDWLNWNAGEPNDSKHNEDCVEFHTWDGHWNDNSCAKTNPSICKCPDNQPEDPSQTDDLPDDPQEQEGDGKKETCSLFLGGQGTGTSWFDTPAQPYDGAICNVFGTRDSCCSSAWVWTNVEDDLFTLTDLVSPDNTGCADAIEALRCIVCSPEQASFMSSSGGKWHVDVCLPTSLAVYKFCLSDAKTLFPGNFSKDGTFLLNAEGMVQELTTRIMGGDKDNSDPDTYTPVVNATSESFGQCFLHDTMSPSLKNASYNGTTLHIIFDEPLSVVPVGMHVEADMLNGGATPSASSSTTTQKEPALMAILKCNTKECLHQKKQGSTSYSAIDGEIIWSVTSLVNSNEVYESTNYKDDTIIVTTFLDDGKTSGKAGDVLDADRSKNGAATFGYVLWLSDNIVFDRAGNSFAGSDMDSDGLIFLKLNEPSSRVWIWIIVTVVGLMVLVGGLFFARSQSRKCQGRGSSSNKDSNFYSSGGFVAIDDP